MPHIEWVMAESDSRMEPWVITVIIVDIFKFNTFPNLKLDQEIFFI